MTNAILVVAGSVCLLIALAQSWLIVAVLSQPEGLAARLVPGSRELIRSHIDYLMMAQFLSVFYGLYRLFAIAAPAWIIVLMCFGSFFNPFAFFVRAVKPSYLTAPPRPYTIMITVSCVATTIGYAATAIILAVAAIRAA